MQVTRLYFVALAEALHGAQSLLSGSKNGKRTTDKKKNNGTISQKNVGSFLEKYKTFYKMDAYIMYYGTGSWGV